MAFISNAAPLQPKSSQTLQQKRQRVNICCSASPNVSRRDLGRIALIATAVELTTNLITPLLPSSAADTKKKPVFIKDESGISYYDVKQGSGAGPTDGDFVVIDYVS